MDLQSPRILQSLFKILVVEQAFYRSVDKSHDLRALSFRRALLYRKPFEALSFDEGLGQSDYKGLGLRRTRERVAFLKPGLTCAQITNKLCLIKIRLKKN